MARERINASRPDAIVSGRPPPQPSAAQGPQLAFDDAMQRAQRQASNRHRDKPQQQNRDAVGEPVRLRRGVAQGRNGGGRDPGPETAAS